VGKRQAYSHSISSVTAKGALGASALAQMKSIATLRRAPLSHAFPLFMIVIRTPLGIFVHCGANSSGSHCAITEQPNSPFCVATKGPEKWQSGSALSADASSVAGHMVNVTVLPLASRPVKVPASRSGVKSNELPSDVCPAHAGSL
jgi:hypothetical protein